MSGHCRPYRERSVAQAVGLWRAFVFRRFRYGRLFKGCTAFGFTVKFPPFCRSACRMAAVARTFDGRRYMRAAVAVWSYGGCRTISPAIECGQKCRHAAEGALLHGATFIYSGPDGGPV